MEPAAARPSAPTFGLDRNVYPGTIATNAYVTLSNCSDPTMAAGSECAYFSYPGDSFAQTGDYMWSAGYGHTYSYTPQSGSTYRAGVVPLISIVSSLQTSLLGTPTPYNGSTLSASATAARAMISSDLTTRNIKDNTPGEANILYLAGHDETTSVAGTKIMLETLLQLGISTLPSITVTTEASRSSPIDASIDGTDAILQGTFDEVTPTPTAPTLLAQRRLGDVHVPGDQRPPARARDLVDHHAGEHVLVGHDPVRCGGRHSRADVRGLQRVLHERVPHGLHDDRGAAACRRCTSSSRARSPRSGR